MDQSARLLRRRRGDGTQRGRVIGAPKPLVVAIVGPAGVGKSFLYKVNRPNITKSSAEGRSCTLYLTKITYLPEAAHDTTSSDVYSEPWARKRNQRRAQLRCFATSSTCRLYYSRQESRSKTNCAARKRRRQFCYDF